MNGKPAGCSACRLSYLGHGFCGDSKRANAKVAVLLTQPSREACLRDDHDRAATNWALFHSIIKPVGFDRMEDILWASVIRCLPPKDEFPTGPNGRHVLNLCRQYDAGLKEFRPTIAMCTQDAETLRKSPVYTRLMQAQFRRAHKFYMMGHRPLVTMGIVPSRLVFPYMPSLKGRLGHYEELAANFTFTI